jgi:hypothetical protein
MVLVVVIYSIRVPSKEKNKMKNFKKLFNNEKKNIFYISIIL